MGWVRTDGLSKWIYYPVFLLFAWQNSSSNHCLHLDHLSAQISDENNDTYTYYILHPSIPHITSTKQHKPSENLLWRFYVGRPGSYISIYTINSSVWIADCYRELNHYHQSHSTSKPPTRPALHTFFYYIPHFHARTLTKLLQHLYPYACMYI